MATFKIELDKRTKKKNNNYNLAIRVINRNEVMFLNISKLTEQQYEHVFIKKSIDEKSIQFREKCNELLSKAERVFNEIKPFDKSKYRTLFFKQEQEVNVIPTKLLLKDLFHRYISEYEYIKKGTRDRYRTSMNVFNSFSPDIEIKNITVDYLKQFERDKLSKGCKPPTVSSYLRDIRRILNYYIDFEKIIPTDYKYPFAKGGYSIKNHNPKKMVMKNIEIELVATLNKFDNPAQEYARNIWLLLYRCNGINYADLLRMRWSDIRGNCFVFTRKKTEDTRRNNIKEIVVPINLKVKDLINKIGVKDSTFVLGKLKEGYTETMFSNKSHKIRQSLNKELTNISLKLNLSVPLKLKTARDAYATTLKRAGISTSVIGEMLGHSNSVVTEHYLDSLDTEKTFVINDVLF